MPNEYNSELSPSKDIVERLKAKPPKGFVKAPLMIEAAAEIERLQKEIMAWWEETELMRSDLSHYSSEIERLREREAIIIGMFRANMMHWADGYSDEDFNAKLAKALGEKK